MSTELKQLRAKLAEVERERDEAWSKLDIAHAGIMAFQAGHEAPWDTAEDEPGTWTVEDANGNLVFEADENEDFSDADGPEDATRITCSLVNAAAEQARKALHRASQHAEQVPAAVVTRNAEADAFNPCYAIEDLRTPYTITVECPECGLTQSRDFASVGMTEVDLAELHEETFWCVEVGPDRAPGCCHEWSVHLTVEMVPSIVSEVSGG